MLLTAKVEHGFLWCPREYGVEAMDTCDEPASGHDDRSPGSGRIGWSAPCESRRVTRSAMACRASPKLPSPTEAGQDGFGASRKVHR